MSTKVTPLGLRLFLEGVEVPVISAQVNAAPDQPALASIQIVPTDMALHLLPRTLVHLFYLDDKPLDDKDGPRQAQDGSFSEANFNRFDAPDNQYKLMFVGEVTGYNYGKNPDSRQLILQCMDLSTYWDSCYQWFADYSVGGGGLTDKHQKFLGAGESLFNSVSGGHKWVIGQIMNEAPVTPAYSDTKGLLGSIIHLLESIGGTPGVDGFNGVNDFFSIAQLRYNLVGMIGALAADDTSARIYNRKAFFDWLRNGMTSLGSVTSFRQIINHVNKYIYHHIYPNVTPSLVRGADIKAKRDVPFLTIRDTSLGQGVLLRAKQARTAISKAGKNVPGGIVIANDKQTFAFLLEAKRWLVSAEEGADTLDTDDKRNITNAIKESLALVKDSLSLFAEIGFDPETEELSEDIEVGDRSNVAAQLDAFLTDARDILDDSVISSAADAKHPKTKRVQTEFNIQGTEGARLNSQLFLPECYFVAPPRCNVLFPDQYFQFSFSRNFMREVSRLSMSSGLGMIAGGGRQGAKLFTRNYFAPNTQDTRGKNLLTTTSRGARILLPHEVHSGIIPKYEWANSGHRWANLAKKRGRNAFTKGGKVGYLQRMANFQFYLHRWSARTMAVSGIFNPHLVIGFPGLVIDRSLPSPDVVKQREATLGRKWMPVQYLGKMVSLSHSVNQGGGQTAVQFTHCRTHRGLDDEFLTALSREQSNTKTQQITINVNIADLLKDARQLSSQPDPGLEEFGLEGPELEQTTSQPPPIKNGDDKRKLVQLYMQGKLSPPKKVRETRAWRGYKVAAVVESSETRELSQEDAAIFNLDPNTTAVVQREVLSNEEGLIDTGTSLEEGIVTITEIVDVGVDVLTIPNSISFSLEREVRIGEPQARPDAIEEQLTPGWFSDLWTNANISEKVYRPLLGTDSITGTGVAMSLAEQKNFFERTIENEVLSAKKPEGESEQKIFTFSEASTIPGSLADLPTIPGSIEEAIDSIVITYSTLRLRDAGVQDYIRQFTQRPVADIEEMLGTYGLEFTDDGEILVPDDDTTLIEGFHSRAFGDYNADVRFPSKVGQKVQAGEGALKALFRGAPGVSVSRAGVSNRKRKTKLRPELDPRGRARARVMEYVRELEFSRGLMG